MQFLKRTMIAAVLGVILLPMTLSAAFLQGKPLPETKSFWVYETAYKLKLNPKPHEGKWLLTGELGYMRNINPRSAVGITLYGGFHDDGSSFAIRGRYRRWLDDRPRISLDLSTGITFANQHNWAVSTSPGLVSSVTLNLSDLIAITMQHNIDRHNYARYYWNSQAEDKSTTNNTTYLGIQLGSYAAIGSTVVVGVIAAIAAASISSMSGL